MRLILTITALTALLALPGMALAAEPLSASLTVYNGQTYDRVAIGETAAATDGYDRLHDVLAPGSSLNTTWISAWFDHPEWQAPKSQFRGDIRSIAAKQDWILSVVSTFPTGTQLTVAMDNRLKILPAGLQLTIRDLAGTNGASLLNGSYTFNAPAPGTVTQLIITAQQQGGSSEPVTPGTYATDGDVDGDGVTSIIDALLVLNMAYGQIELTDAGLAHGDMDGDGVLRLADALAVMRKSVGL